MTERPHFHKLKMAALAAKTLFKFSNEIVIEMYKPIIVYFLRGGEDQYSLFK